MEQHNAKVPDALKEAFTQYALEYTNRKNLWVATAAAMHMFLNAPEKKRRDAIELVRRVYDEHRLNSDMGRPAKGTPWDSLVEDV